MSGTEHADHVYAVGDDGTVLHWVDYAVESIDVGTTADLFGIWVEHEESIYIVGAGGTVVTWDGITWDAGVVTSADLHDVHGHGADVIAVGTGGTVLMLDGGSWRASLSGTTVTLRDVWVGETTAFAVGDEGTILELR